MKKYDFSELLNYLTSLNLPSLAVDIYTECLEEIATVKLDNDGSLHEIFIFESESNDTYFSSRFFGLFLGLYIGEVITSSQYSKINELFGKVRFEGYGLYKD